MKTLKLKMLLTFCLVAFVSSCSLLKKNPSDGINALTNYDHNKISRVEQTALNNGVRVIWVHPPLKKKD